MTDVDVMDVGRIDTHPPRRRGSTGRRARRFAVVLAIGALLALAACAPPPAAAPPPAPAGAPGHLLFGIGPEADGAAATALARETPVRMLTSWYNGPGDLAWMSGWRTSVVPQDYAAGDALHLVVWTGDAEQTIPTAYGTACGRPYPLSARFLGDMTQLADIFAGAVDGPPLYVTLFTEFQTYPCTDNAWNPDAATNAYHRALKDRYLETVQIFRTHAPNARVSLGWGGWQTRWDDPAIGGGRSMFGYFADVMRQSQFQSFQAMQSDTNVDDIRRMTSTLAAYGPVMLAHYKPDNGSQATFDADTAALLTDASVADLRARGLFAWSFMDNHNLAASAGSYARVAAAVTRYGTGP